MVKKNLKKALGKELATTDHLYTMMMEREAVLNSRPLVYVGTELEDQVALTPGNFFG